MARQASTPIDRMSEALAGFRRRYPSYEGTRKLDELRAREYSRLDLGSHVYLDYTGAGLYADSQVRAHMDLLTQEVYGNPHSDNPTSKAATELVQRARTRVLEFFGASPEEYVAIFTANATAALKLVGEAYPFAPGGRYLMTFDNHNSVNGMREYALARGAEVSYVPILPPDMRVEQERLRSFLDQAVPGANNLFSYPAQSNFSGVQHPLEWIGEAQERGWDVVVDCAAFAPTNRLDLGVWRPDFVPLSFYKIFGYPTGVGALLARKSALAKLRRPWFAGGTITAASVQAGTHLMAEGEAAFEDGTVNFLGLPAVEIGLKHLESVGIDVVHQRVNYLAGWLLDSLEELRHSNGQPLARVYGPTDRYMRGATVTLNFYDPKGHPIDHRRVDALVTAAKISLRTGCFCNPGAGEVAHGLTREEMEEAFRNAERMTFDQFLAVIERVGGKSAGAVRVSLGLATNFDDVYRFVDFASGFLDREAAQV